MREIFDGAITTAISCGSVFTFGAIRIGFGTGLLLAAIPFVAWLFLVSVYLFEKE